MLYNIIKNVNNCLLYAGSSNFIAEWNDFSVWILLNLSLELKLTVFFEIHYNIVFSIYELCAFCKLSKTLLP